MSIHLQSFGWFCIVFHSCRIKNIYWENRCKSIKNTNNKAEDVNPSILITYKGSYRLLFHILSSSYTSCWHNVEELTLLLLSCGMENHHIPTSASRHTTPLMSGQREGEGEHRAFASWKSIIKASSLLEFYLIAFFRILELKISEALCSRTKILNAVGMLRSSLKESIVDL